MSTGYVRLAALWMIPLAIVSCSSDSPQRESAVTSSAETDTAEPASAEPEAATGETERADATAALLPAAVEIGRASCRERVFVGV